MLIKILYEMHGATIKINKLVVLFIQIKKNILLSRVYCIWQVVKTPTIISNHPVFRFSLKCLSKISLKTRQINWYIRSIKKWSWYSCKFPILTKTEIFWTGFSKSNYKIFHEDERERIYGRTDREIRITKILVAICYHANALNNGIILWRWGGVKSGENITGLTT